MSIETTLHEEIQNEFEGLKTMELGTEAYKVTVDGITKLMDRAIEMEKNDQAAYEREKDRQQDVVTKMEQREEERKSRWTNVALTVFTTGVSSALAYWGTVKSFEFEKEGTVTTLIGRLWNNKLIPKK